MTKDALLAEQARIRSQLNSLPAGSITEKYVQGITYFYHRRYKNGEPFETPVTETEAKELQNLLIHRQDLERALREITRHLRENDIPEEETFPYLTDVLTGSNLKSWVQQHSKPVKRECFFRLTDFLYNDPSQKVLCLCGLKGTGKATMMYQAIDNMDPDCLYKTAFFRIHERNTIGELNRDLHRLRTEGYRYIFIDEVTLLEDFIDVAAFLPDVFGYLGIKIVLSGTDSLGFVLAKGDQLYNRCRLIHTTFIPYRDFVRFTQNAHVETFLRCGGTMCQVTHTTMFRIF